MNSFNDIYNDRKEELVESKRIQVAKDHARLVEAMKTNFMINSFSDLNDKGREYCKSLIESMWDKNTGLNEKGVAFINEGKAPITPKSTEAQVKKHFQREVNKSIDKVIVCIAKGGADCPVINSVKKSIEKDLTHKIPASSIKEWVNELVDAHMHRNCKKLKLA